MGNLAGHCSKGLGDERTTERNKILASLCREEKKRKILNGPRHEKALVHLARWGKLKDRKSVAQS